MQTHSEYYRRWEAFLVSTNQTDHSWANANPFPDFLYNPKSAAHSNLSMLLTACLALILQE